MSALTIIALTLTVLFAAVLLRDAVRGRRKPQPARDLERSSASVDAERDPTEPRAEPAKPPPAQRPRATIPPTVAEALASEPAPAFPPAPAPPTPTPARTPTPTPPAPAPAPSRTPAPARVPAVAPADRTAIEGANPERKKARKLARLVVSEIKLYNEKLVAEGLAAGDLYTRLKEAIDQSLIVYRRRVPEAVRAEFDYMDDEIVRQLAGGDASKLGPDYERLRRG